MTNPFATIVGLRGLNNEPRSLFVNDLPGISTELVTALRKDDQTVADTWVRSCDLALSKLSAMLETEFNKSGEFKHTVAQSSVWSIKAAPQTITGATDLQGVRITVPYSPYRQVVIDGMLLHLTGSGTINVPIKVIDLQTGDLLEDLSKDYLANYRAGVAVGPITVPVPMYGLDLFVGIDPAGLTINELGGAAQSMRGDSASTMATGTLSANWRTASGFTASDCRAWFLVSVSHSLPALVERYANELADAFRHLVGSCLMEDKRGSTRINLYTSTNLEFAAEKAEKYECDALKLLKPIARRILSDLDNVPGPVVQADSEVQAGYYRGSMLG